MRFSKKDESISSYAKKIVGLSQRYLGDIILTKGQSKAILRNDCPYCEKYTACSGMIKEYPEKGQIFMPCLIRSTDTDMVWLSIRADDRKSVKIGDKFGNLTVVQPIKPDKYGKLRWLCKCVCGKHMVVRGDNLLSDNTTSCGCSKGGDRKSKNYQSRRTQTIIVKEERMVAEKVESKFILSSHPATSFESRVGKSVDVSVIIELDKERYPITVSGKCGECGGRVRFDDHEYKICEKCLVESSPVPDLKCIPEDAKIIDINESYSHINPLDTFGQPPDDTLRKRILLDEIEMSDHIDNMRGEFNSVPFRDASEWEFISKYGFAPGSDVEGIPDRSDKADWWENRKYPAFEVITSDYTGKEYTLYEGQQIAYVENFLEKCLARLKRSQ
jgi:hypothetical protein